MSGYKKNGSATVHTHSNPLLLTRICVHQLPIGIPPTAFRVWQMDHTERDLWLICPTEILSFLRLAVKKRKLSPAVLNVPWCSFAVANLQKITFEDTFDVRLFQIPPDVNGDIRKYLIYWFFFFNSFLFGIYLYTYFFLLFMSKYFISKLILWDMICNRRYNELYICMAGN